MGQNTRFMVSLAWQHQKSVLALGLLTAFFAVSRSTAELLVVPVILGQVEAAVSLKSLLLTILGFTALLLVLAAAGSYLGANVLYGRIALRTYLVDQVNRKTLTTSYPNTEDPAALRLREKAQNCTGDNNQAAEAIWTTLTNLVQNGTGFLIYLVLLSGLPPLLILAVLITSVTGYLVNTRIHVWEYRHRDEQAGPLQKMRYILDSATQRYLAKDIRLFGMMPWLEDIFADALRLYQAFAAKRERLYVWTNVLDMILTLLRNGIAYAYLVGLVLAGNLTASEFLLYFTAVSGFSGWINGILSGFSTLHRQSLDLSTLREYLDLPEPFLYESGKPLSPSPQETYTLRLEHVSFRYSGADKDVLHDLDITIRAGEKLAIVGQNGAGKTTLVKLLCGFYDPTEGRVLLNGADIRQYNRRDYYRLFSAVFQQFSLLEATLTENVAQTSQGLGIPIDAGRITECMEKAGLSKKVDSLPGHLDTHLGRQVYEDGVEFSGGELQRLMLARALYKDAPILILDEPTAALDPIAEDDIYQKYNEMMKHRTSVFISHRLASTRFCDRILYLSEGRVAEEGTHDSLLSLNGQYAALFQIQSKYYQEGASCHEA